MATYLDISRANVYHTLVEVQGEQHLERTGSVNPVLWPVSDRAT